MRKYAIIGAVVAVVTVAAVALDFVLTNLVLGEPQAFSPSAIVLTTLAIAIPTAWVRITVQLRMRRIKDELAASLAEQAEAHQAAEAAMARLRESEARFRMLTDRATDIIIRYDLSGTIEYASPSVRQCGYAPEDLVGRHMAAFVHEDDQANINVVRDHVARDDLAGLGDPHHEFRARCADGRWIWMEGNPAPIYDEAGAVVGSVTVLRDITARRAIEDELRRKQAEAEAALAVKSDFLANMTHELRTPLNAIIGFSGLLRGSAELSVRDARQATLIWDASQTLLSVVNDVLDFCKLEAGAVDLDIHPFDPRATADSAAALLADQARAKGLMLSVEAAGEQGPLMGDSARLRQVLLNFISNAIKFTARGGVDVRVAQTPAGDGRRRLRIEVADTGIGVPAEQVEAIFGRFTQGDASVSRQYGGTGLGLAICKRIVGALGGEIGVISEEGCGSTFWFEVVMPVAAALDEAAPEAEPAGPVLSGQAMRLLVVDDNAVNRELIAALLAPFELDILTARDGVEAVEAAAASAFDLILMDVQMPAMDGLTATRRIRAAEPPGARRTPIVAMTANVLPEQVARCLEAGMDDHLGKPIRPGELVETLGRWSAGGGEAAAAKASAGMA